MFVRSFVIFQFFHIKYVQNCQWSQVSNWWWYCSIQLIVIQISIQNNISMFIHLWYFNYFILNTYRYANEVMLKIESGIVPFNWLVSSILETKYINIHSFGIFQLFHIEYIQRIQWNQVSNWWWYCSTQLIWIQVPIPNNISTFIHL